jgi:hypothetical protein
MKVKRSFEVELLVMKSGSHLWVVIVVRYSWAVVHGRFGSIHLQGRRLS